jgi:hypothetical protein
MSKDLQLALEGLRRERAESQQRVETLDAAIAEFERTMAKLDAGYKPATVTAEGKKEFTGMLLRDAAEIILKRHGGGPLATRPLCNELLEGGYKSTARDFYMVVYGGLKGMPNFARTPAGAWVWQEGAKPGSYTTDDKKAAKAAGKGR